MADTVKIYAYNHVAYDTEVELRDVESIHVLVLTGDEILTIRLKDGKSINIDVQDVNGIGRTRDYFDGQYDVCKDDLLEWNGREDSYAW